MIFLVTGSWLVPRAWSFLGAIHLGTFPLHTAAALRGFICRQLLLSCLSFFWGHCFIYQFYYHEVLSHSVWPRPLPWAPTALGCPSDLLDSKYIELSLSSSLLKAHNLLILPCFHIHDRARDVRGFLNLLPSFLPPFKQFPGLVQHVTGLTPSPNITSHFSISNSASVQLRINDVMSGFCLQLHVSPRFWVSTTDTMGYLLVAPFLHLLSFFFIFTATLWDQC